MFPSDNKDGIENIIPFAESGQVVPALNMIFDHKWLLRSNNSIDNENKKNENQLPHRKVLQQHCEKKTNEIKQICNQNYNSFVDAIDQILQK